MLRYHRFLIGALWVPEYGDPDDAERLRRARTPTRRTTTSPTGTAYPATLITTAESDSRVDPLHARKFAARLQAATAAPDDRPVLLRIETRAGHGVGKPAWKQADEVADVWAFVFWQLGMRFPAGRNEPMSDAFEPTHSARRIRSRRGAAGRRPGRQPDRPPARDGRGRGGPQHRG